MAFTSIKSDLEYIKSDLKLSTNPGRYHLDVPGPGDKIPFNLDPFVRLQKHGCNTRTNTIQIENDLFGMSKPLNKDFDKFNYKNFEPINAPIIYDNINPYTKHDEHEIK